MSVLIFSPVQIKGQTRYQACFDANTPILMQFAHDAGDYANVNVSVSIRLSPDFPYTPVKMMSGVGKSFLVPFNFGENIQVLVDTETPSLRAAYTPLASSIEGGSSSVDLSALSAELSRQNMINEQQQSQIDANTDLNAAQELGMGSAETAAMLNEVFGQ